MTHLELRHVIAHPLLRSQYDYLPSLRLVSFQTLDLISTQIQDQEFVFLLVQWVKDNLMGAGWRLSSFVSTYMFKWHWKRLAWWEFVRGGRWYRKSRDYARGIVGADIHECEEGNVFIALLWFTTTFPMISSSSMTSSRTIQLRFRKPHGHTAIGIDYKWDIESHCHMSLLVIQ